MKLIFGFDVCSWKSCLSPGSEEGSLCMRSLCLSASLETPGWAQPNGTGQLPLVPHIWVEVWLC